MTYKVIPFNAHIKAGEGADSAAAQLEGLVNDLKDHGWDFHGLETVDTDIMTPAVPGTNGCLGIGAMPGMPEQHTNVSAYVAVFHQP